ncbi:ASCH domain-containing protein [Paraclostridium sp. AKS81]|uniref:ASCH domain-containing protein n=1 Tax=Paraclostridium sp. AKS81 TaxID=2876117 RepID=UPI0021E04814|nr:ASCH domain-containing protein [Paraclostridium sp. AKS81]
MCYKNKRDFCITIIDVDERLASIEGEGDKSLRYWREAHIDFFKRELEALNMEFIEDMLVVFEEFEVVYK